MLVQKRGKGWNEYIKITGKRLNEESDMENSQKWQVRGPGFLDLTLK